MKVYITFGQIHAHAVNGKTFDKDSVASIECDNYRHGREIAFEAFDDKWAFAYDKLDDVGLHYFPRGIIELN